MPETEEKVDPEKTKKLGAVSAGITISTGILWALWDVVPAMWQGRNDTISENIRNWSRYAWLLPWFWGALSAHFFLNIEQPDNYQNRFYAFAAITLAGVLCNLGVYFLAEWEAPAWFRAVAFFAGIMFGLFLWGQDA